MLELKAEIYCENCSHFEADVFKSVEYEVSNKTVCDTYVTCKYAGHCKRLYEYLKGEINGKS